MFGCLSAAQAAGGGDRSAGLIFFIFYFFLSPEQYDNEKESGIKGSAGGCWRGGQIGGVDTCVKDRCHTEQSGKWDSSQKRDDGGPETPKSFSLEMCVCVWTRD